MSTILNYISLKKYCVYRGIQRPLLILLNKKYLKLLWNTDMNQFPNKQSDLLGS